MCFVRWLLSFVHSSALSSWSEFSEQALKKYGVDMSGLDQAYDEECAGYFSLSSLWRELSGRQVVSEPTTVQGEHPINMRVKGSLSVVCHSRREKRGGSMEWSGVEWGPHLSQAMLYTWCLFGADEPQALQFRGHAEVPDLRV